MSLARYLFACPCQWCQDLSYSPSNCPLGVPPIVWMAALLGGGLLLVVYARKRRRTCPRCKEPLCSCGQCHYLSCRNIGRTRP